MKQVFRTTFYLIVAVISAIAFQSCSTSKTTIDKKALTGSWILNSLNGEEATSAFKGNRPFLAFNFDQQIVSGNGGCNTYTGPFSLEGGIFKAENLAATSMACLEENKESDFFKTLSNKQGLTIAIANDVLSFKDEDGKAVIEFVKFVPPVIAEDVIVSLEDMKGNWTLSKINGENASTLFPDKPVTFIVKDEGKIHGNAGCNNYGTSIKSLENNTLILFPIISNQMACPQLKGEEQFSAILMNGVDVSINEKILQFHQKGEIVLEFTLDQK